MVEFYNNRHKAHKLWTFHLLNTLNTGQMHTWMPIVHKTRRLCCHFHILRIDLVHMSVLPLESRYIVHIVFCHHARRVDKFLVSYIEHLSNHRMANTLFFWMYCYISDIQMFCISECSCTLNNHHMADKLDIHPGDIQRTSHSHTFLLKDRIR